MMSPCGQSKLCLCWVYIENFPCFQRLNETLGKLRMCHNNTWHSSQTSPSPHLGSADSKSSNLQWGPMRRGRAWKCPIGRENTWEWITSYMWASPKQQLFSRNGTVEDVFIGLVHCSQYCPTFHLFMTFQLGTKSAQQNMCHVCPLDNQEMSNKVDF